MGSSQHHMWLVMQHEAWNGGHQRYRTTSYLMFYATLSDSGKTASIAIITVKDVRVIGHIKWFSRWRQYAFFPEEGSVWNRVCMAEVLEELDGWRATRYA